jgi:hypothetical protein
MHTLITAEHVETGDSVAARTKARRSQRVVRSFKKNGEDYISTFSLETLKRTFKPEVELSFYEFGLDSEVRLGGHDLEKIGTPERIKVVIYSLDD